MTATPAVFALANAGVVVNASDLSEPIVLAIVGGLVVGKLVGVSLVSWLAVRSGLAQLPTRAEGTAGA